MTFDIFTSFVFIDMNILKLGAYFLEQSQTVNETSIYLLNFLLCGIIWRMDCFFLSKLEWIKKQNYVFILGQFIWKGVSTIGLIDAASIFHADINSIFFTLRLIILEVKLMRNTICKLLWFSRNSFSFYFFASIWIGKPFDLE